MNFLKQIKLFITVFSVIACLVAFSGLQVFASEPEEDESPGIPAYAISRLKVLSGVIYSKTPDSDWQEATTNTPLGPNNRVSVPDEAEAELQFHAGQFVLLTSGVDIEILGMSEERTRFRLRAGEIRFDLPGDDFAPVSVRVPGGATARFDEPGRYWLAATDEDSTHLVVRRGHATVAQEGETTRILEGQQAVIGRSITVSQYNSTGESTPDPAPPTTQERDTGVPPVVSYELRDYGKWVYTSSYGYVWQPRVASNWSPYVYGRWEWVSPYGWTWIAYEPWGWYPYRTGYWVSVAGIGWVWTPYGSFVSISFPLGWGYYRNYGYYHHRNFYYRTANARFIPEGRNVRWVPLQPGERYRSPAMSRNDSRLLSWNRALESNSVYVAQSGTEPGSRQWRDVRTVQAERQAAVTARSSATSASRVDMRPVRPEQMRSASQAAGSTRSSSAINTSRDASSTRGRPGVSSMSPSRDISSIYERSGVSSMSPSRGIVTTREQTAASPTFPSRDNSSVRERPTGSYSSHSPSMPSRSTGSYSSPSSSMPSRSTGSYSSSTPSRSSSSSSGRGSSTVGRSGGRSSGSGFSRGGGGFGSSGGSRGGGRGR